MEQTMESRERSRDFERFLTFIDAIVAIAVTLLILPLVDVTAELDHGGSVADLLSDNQARIGAFFLSFLVIARLWLVQHHVLSNVVAASRALTNLLLLWCLTIVVLPFPTALMSGPNGSGDEALTKVLYVGTMAVASFLLGCACVVLSRHDELRDSPERPDTVRAFGTTATFLVALAVMLLVPGSSYWPLLLLVVSDRVIEWGTDLVHRRR
jgi:uncharacterized membrane protein